MNIEDDDYCTADYGIWGENNCNCSSCKPPIPKRDLKREAQAMRESARRDQERKVSSDFNSHMIDLYNARQRP